MGNPMTLNAINEVFNAARPPVTLNYLAFIQMIHWHHALVQNTKHNQLPLMNHVVNDVTDMQEAKNVLANIRPGFAQRGCFG